MYMVVTLKKIYGIFKIISKIAWLDIKAYIDIAHYPKVAQAPPV